MKSKSDKNISLNDIKFDFQSMNVHFSNIINVTAKQEEVHLVFAVREHMNNKGEIINGHKIVVTVPHFLTIKSIFDNVLESYVKSGLVKKKE